MISKNLTIREAICEDIDALATMHHQSWGETYQGLLSGKTLEYFSREKLIAQWTYLLTHKESQSICFIAEIDGKISGFIDCGPQRTSKIPELALQGEYYALYVLARAQKLGIGWALFERATQFLQQHFDKQSLWVLKSNQKARLFYEKCHGREIQSCMFQVGDETVEKILYIWST